MVEWIVTPTEEVEVQFALLVLLAIKWVLVLVLLVIKWALLEIPLPIQNVTNLPLNGQNMVEWIVTPTETTTTTTIYNNTHFITNFPEFTNFHSFKPRNPLFLGQS